MGGSDGVSKGRLAESFRPPLRPLTPPQVRGASQKHRLTCAIWLAGQVSNLQPPDPKIDAPQSADLRKRPETASGLLF